MSDNKEYLVETDILVDHLVNVNSEKSVLEKAMESGICFTTVVNSSEVYFAVENEEEKNAVDALMKSVKVLGLHSRYSLTVNEFTGKVSSVRDAMICATAKLNKLPILTGSKKKYHLTELKIVAPKDL